MRFTNRSTTIYGHYCGPYWSDSKLQTSVCGSTPPIDILDRSCQLHDCDYFNSNSPEDLIKADNDFLIRNRSIPSYSSSLFSTLVGAQLSYRQMVKNSSSPTPRLRGAATNAAPRTLRTRPRRNRAPRRQADMPTAITSVAAAYGTTISGGPPGIKRSANGGMQVTGSDCIGLVTSANFSDFFISSVVPLHPAFWTGTSIATYCRSMSKYRFRKLVIEYVPAVPTSEQGSVVVTTTKTVLEPVLNASSTVTFVATAIATGFGQLTPIWKGSVVPAHLDEIFRLTDPFTSVDVDDQILGEVIAYSQSATSAVAGYLLAHYVCDFIEPSYTLHSTFIPVPAGLAGTATWTDNANEVAGAALIVVPTTGINPPSGTAVDGTVFRMILDVDATVLATGVTASNVLQVTNQVFSATVTASFNTQSLVIQNGQSMYGNLVAGKLYMYNSFDNAVAGTGQGLLSYASTVSFKTVWSFWMYPLRMGQRLISVQL